MTGRGPWVVGDVRAGRPAVADVLVVARTGARVQVAQVRDDGTHLLLDAPVPAGAVLVGAQDPVPDVPPPTGVPPGPVRSEVQVAGTVTGRGPLLAGLPRRGTVEQGDVPAVVGSGATVRVRSVDTHRRETGAGTVLGPAIHADDAGHVPGGAVPVDRGGQP